MAVSHTNDGNRKPRATELHTAYGIPADSRWQFCILSLINH